MIEARYRWSFVKACLAGAPAEAAAWISQLEELVYDEIRPMASEVDRQSRFPRESLSKLRGIGAFGVAAPKQAGGLGFGNAAAALMIETVAAACPSTAAVLMFHNQVVGRIDRFGCTRQQRNDLERLAKGEWIAASAWTELGAGADKSSLQTRLTRGKGEARVNGEKHFCTGLEGADLIHVLLDASSENGKPAPTFVRIERSYPGVEVPRIYDLMGLRGSSTGTLRLLDVPVDDTDIIGKVGDGVLLMRANHETLMNPGLLALGIARAAYEDAKVSVQGLAHGSRNTTGFQSTRCTIADMELKLGAAYAYAASVVHLLKAGVSDLHVECTKIKVHASETACEVVSAAVRLAGGRGFSADWPFERHFRDAQATVLMGPANEVVKERIATQVLADAHL
jgi:alkylation response protein AidB-like acyl-CoA dehydrogenase